MPADPRADVIKKALTDAAFKASLLKDPKAAVEKASGAKLPAGVTIKVVEDTASVVHLVLPASSAPAKGELSENDLGKVSGGVAIENTKGFLCVDSSNQQINVCK